ncbi:MAG TPA: hypothetical protein VMN38_10780 [Sphingomicrobium sp.]|nr:hypothetical protein [Sphingomicrobium sp.]
MRKLILVAATAALIGCSQEQPAAESVNDADVAMDVNTTDANVTGTALASINETTWEFTDPDTGKPIQESVDATGNYIANSGEEHFDHGTAVMKDGKACFTSAMTKEGEICWTDPMLAEGESGETTSDKGEKLTVKRTAYVPLTM